MKSRLPILFLVPASCAAIAGGAAWFYLGAETPRPTAASPAMNPGADAVLLSTPVQPQPQGAAPESRTIASAPAQTVPAPAPRTDHPSSPISSFPAVPAEIETTVETNLSPRERPVAESTEPVAETPARSRPVTAPLPAFGPVAFAAVPPAEKKLPLPVAFQDFDPGTESQAAALDSLRLGFLGEIGGPNRNPRDRDYPKVFVPAKKKLDEQFRLFFGTEAFNAAMVNSLSE